MLGGEMAYVITDEAKRVEAICKDVGVCDVVFCELECCKQGC